MIKISDDASVFVLHGWPSYLLQVILLVWIAAGFLFAILMGLKVFFLILDKLTQKTKFAKLAIRYFVFYYRLKRNK